MQSDDGFSSFRELERKPNMTASSIEIVLCFPWVNQEISRIKSITILSYFTYLKGRAKLKHCSFI